MELLMDVIRGIRNIRGEMNIAPGKEVNVIIAADNNEIKETIEDGIDYIENLAKVKEVDLAIGAMEAPRQSAVSVVKGARIFVPLAGLIDLEVEVKRLQKELSMMEKELMQVEKKLANEGFLEKAPSEVVNKEKRKKGRIVKYIK